MFCATARSAHALTQAASRAWRELRSELRQRDPWRLRNSPSPRTAAPATAQFAPTMPVTTEAEPIREYWEFPIFVLTSLVCIATMIFVCCYYYKIRSIFRSLNKYSHGAKRDLDVDVDVDFDMCTQHI